MSAVVNQTVGTPVSSDDLGFEINRALPWFAHAQDEPYVLIRVSEEHARTWVNELGIPLRRCFITDAVIEKRAAELGVSEAQIVAARLPDPGATMAGDFGEILVYFYQAARVYPQVAIGPKKWRLKQDRTKPAPHSDVVQFVLPSWPKAGLHDKLFCSEVKTKSTAGNFAPIAAAIEGSATDRTSRLARTLVWLRERALLEDLGDVTVEQLERFINTSDHPAATKRFRAVAIICSNLLEGELGDAPTQRPDDYEVVVISVPELHKVYNDIFRAALHTVTNPEPLVSTGGS